MGIVSSLPALCARRLRAAGARPRLLSALLAVQRRGQPDAVGDLAERKALAALGGQGPLGDVAAFHVGSPSLE
jgi:hypothetical protein